MPRSLCRRERIGRFLSYSSIAEIENDVSIAVDFDQVLEFRVCDDGDSLRKCGAELQIQANGSLSREIHVIVLPEFRGQIVGVKGVAVGEVGPTEAVTLVSIILSCSCPRTGRRTPPRNGRRQSRVSAVSSCTIVRLSGYRFP
jgi:hypothetical protein